MDTFSVLDLTPTETMDLASFLDERPTEAGQSLPATKHGKPAERVLTYAFSISTIIACLIWLNNQSSKSTIRFSVDIGGAKIELSVAKDEATRAIERVRTHSLPKQ
jgi:hypothetical protein